MVHRFWKSVSWLVAGLALVLGLGASAQAQDAPPKGNFTPVDLPNWGLPCFPDSLFGRGARTMILARPNTGTDSSYFGAAFTPRGTLRMLVIYAGLTNDNDQLNPGLNGNNNDPGNTWPQLDLPHGITTWGDALPRNAYDGSVYYTDTTQFDTAATDQSISNYYYQMSRRSKRGALKVVVSHLPRRVNVPMDSVGGVAWELSRGSLHPIYGLIKRRISGSVDFYWHTKKVLEKVAADYDGSPYTFNWTTVDRRRNDPKWTRDCSGYEPDSTIDFVVVVWRVQNNGFRMLVPKHVPTFPGDSLVWRNVSSGGAGGLAGVSSGGVRFRQAGSSRTWGVGVGYTQIYGEQALHVDLFRHEIGHLFYAAPHYFGAQGRTARGKHFHLTGGWGMMGYDASKVANGWERWYNGWMELKASGANTDISSPADLNSTPLGPGVYTLRDYATTNDVVRIKIPLSDQMQDPNTGQLMPAQYLWLENHQRVSPFEQQQPAYDGNGELFPVQGKGLFAMVDDMHVGRANPLPVSAPTMNEYTNAFKVLGKGMQLITRDTANHQTIDFKRGHYDFALERPAKVFRTVNSTNQNPQEGYLWSNRTYNLQPGQPNSLSGYSEMNTVWSDKYDWVNAAGDTVPITPGFLNYCGGSGNQDGCEDDETVIFAVVNHARMAGFRGADIAFNEVGDKLGMMTNPAITPHQRYYKTTTAMSAMPVHGLSVEIIAKDTVTGAITVKVRFDDVDVPGVSSNQDDLRWTGEIALYDNPDVVGADLNIPNQATLLLDESGTPNRHTLRPGTTDKFVNLTKMTCYDGSLLNVESGGKLLVKNQSKLILKSGSVLHLHPNAELRLESGAEVIIEDSATLLVESGAKVVVRADAHLTIQNTDEAKGLVLSAGALLEAQNNGEIRVMPGARLDLTTSYVPGTGGGVTSGLVLNDNASHLLIDKSTLKVAKDVDFTFGGTGYITFKGQESALELDPATSHWTQAGPSRPNVLYELKEGAALHVRPASFELQNGRLRYDADCSLTVETPKPVFLENIDFLGVGQTYGALALDCISPEFTATGCAVHFFSDGMRIESTGGTTVTNSTMDHITRVGWDFLDSSSVVLSGGEVHHCGQAGVRSVAPVLYLRGGVRIWENYEGVVSETDSSQLIIGDQGCAWIINNSHRGVRGKNIHLDIDALRHQQQNSSTIAQINRFDGNTVNGGKIFRICYDAGQMPTAFEMSAEGNYWGGASPTALTDYVLTNCSDSSAVHKLDADSVYACAPTSCTDCNPPARPGGPVIAESAAGAVSLALMLIPNPAQDRVSLTVEERGAYQYRIITPQGQTLVTGEFAGGAADVRTAGWPSGAYRVVLWNVDTKARASQTLVVE